MERFVIMADGATITEEQAALLIGQGKNEITAVQDLEGLKKAKKVAREKAVAQIERTFVLNALARNDWNVSRAAREIGIQRSNLHALMRKHGIKPKVDAG